MKLQEALFGPIFGVIPELRFAIYVKICINNFWIDPQLPHTAFCTTKLGSDLNNTSKHVIPWSFVKGGNRDTSTYSNLQESNISLYCVLNLKLFSYICTFLVAIVGADHFSPL